MIAFADALLNCEDSGVKKVLVLCPVNTVNNWKVEFFKWISFRDCDYNVSPVAGPVKAEPNPSPPQQAILQNMHTRTHTHTHRCIFFLSPL